MSFRPTLPLVPSPAVRTLLAHGHDGQPLVRWPKGPDHRPGVRILLRAEATDAGGAVHPFLHVASVTLTGPPDLTPVATARVHNREEAPREWVYLDDGDGGLFAAPPATQGPGHARDMALRELDHLAARLLGPDLPADPRARDEPYHAALAAGCPVLTLAGLAAAPLPTLDGLKASGVEVRATNASDISARAALAVGRAFAWTGDALALPARLPHWNLACDEAGRVRLTCRVGDPRDLAAWSAAAGFPLAEGTRALAAAKAVAAASGSRTVTVVGEAEVLDPAADAYDGARETAAAMAKPLRALLRKVLPLLDDPAREASSPLVDRDGPLDQPGAAADWWRSWRAFAATLPDEEPEGERDLRRLHLARIVLDASGYASDQAVPEAAPQPDEPEPEPEPVRERGPDEAAALASAARLVLAGLEFSVLAQTEAAKDQGRHAEILRDAASVGADLMPYLAQGGDAYREAWEEVLQAGIAMRASRDAGSLDRLARGLAALWEADPESFPDIPSAARWAMDLRPRQRAVTRACAALAAEAPRANAQPQPERPAVEIPAVTVRRAAPPPRAPGRGRATARPAYPAPLPPPLPPPDPEPAIEAIPIVEEPTPDRPSAVWKVASPPVPPAEQVRPEPAAVPGPPASEPGADIPSGVDEGEAASDAPPEPDRSGDPAPDPVVDGTGRPTPTRNGRLVIAAMEGRPPMRKTDIAAIVGIGRGAANRTVDRLVLDGWMVPDGTNLFRLAAP